MNCDEDDAYKFPNSSWEITKNRRHSLFYYYIDYSFLYFTCAFWRVFNSFLGMGSISLWILESICAGNFSGIRLGAEVVDRLTCVLLRAFLPVIYWARHASFSRLSEFSVFLPRSAYPGWKAGERMEKEPSREFPLWAFEWGRSCNNKAIRMKGKSRLVMGIRAHGSPSPTRHSPRPRGMGACCLHLTFRQRWWLQARRISIAALSSPQFIQLLLCRL